MKKASESVAKAAGAPTAGAKPHHKHKHSDGPEMSKNGAVHVHWTPDKDPDGQGSGIEGLLGPILAAFTAVGTGSK